MGESREEAAFPPICSGKEKFGFEFGMYEGGKVVESMYGRERERLGENERN